MQTINIQAQREDGKIFIYTLRHDSDYEGDVDIDLPADQIDMWQRQVFATDTPGATVHIPFTLMKELVSRYMTTQAITRTEG